MGYSNVAGDLNVAGTTTLSTLVVNGSTYHYGPITSTSNAVFGNLVASNLTVTGNFTVTATNTQVSNAISIVNQGSATALYVNQNESVAHTHNSLEIWDHTTLAMVVDPNGNVAIHQARSDGYSLSVVGGISMDVLTLGTPLAISSGGTGTATGATQNYVFAGPSIGSAGAPSFRALVNADLPSYISVSNISANGSALSNLTGSNVTGNVSNATVALVVSQGAQPNITSVGFLTNLAVSNSLTTSNIFLSGNLNVQQTANIYIANIANIYTTNIVGFVGSQWTTGTGNIFYLSNVGIGTGAVSANLSVTGNIYASNALTTTNLYLTGNLNVQQTANIFVANIANIYTTNIVGFVGSQWTTGTGNIFYLSNVGIGTGAVSANLSVTGNIYASNALTTTNLYLTGNLNVQQTANIFVANIANIYTTNIVGFVGSQWTTGTGNVFYLSNVGIGTSAVPSNLAVVGTSYFSSNVGIGTTSTVSLFEIYGVGPRFSIMNSTGVSNRLGIDFYTYTNEPVAGGQIESLDDGNYSAHMYFNTKTPGGPTNSLVNRFTILSSGLIGIATSTPTSNLQVTGNIYASNAITSPNAFHTNVFVTGNVNVQGISNLYVANIATANVSTLNVSSISVSGSTPTSGYVLSTTGTGLAWIAAGGGGSSQWTTGTGNIYYLSNVGIGTSLVTSNLSVTGNIYASNALTTTNLFTAGFTSNASNTIFNYDTVTIPFIYSTTTNVSTLNVASISVPGSTPTSGYVLSTTGTGLAWIAAGGGSSQWTTGTGNIYYLSNVGIGTSVVASNLAVVGNAYVSNALTTTNVYASNIADQTGSFGTTGQVLTKAAAGTLWATGGGSSQWTTGTGNIYYLSNVGIGTSVVASNLAVVGNVTVSNGVTATNVISTTANTATLNVASISVSGSTPTAGYILSTTGTGLAWIPAGGAGSTQWAGTAGNPIYYIQNVGIGTNNPTANLSVSGNLYVSNSVTTTNLISPGFSSNTTNAIFSQDTATIPILTTYNLNVLFSANVSTLVTPGLFSGVNPNVGIGITTPSSSLHVAGNAYVSNGFSTSSIYYGDDTSRRGPHIVPTVSNATQIQSWISFQSNIVSQQSSFWAPATRPIFSTMSIGPPSSNAYVGSVAMADGRTVFIPYGASTFGVFNSITNQYSAVVPSGAALTPTSGWGNGLYFGGVQAPSGNIVCIPHASGNIGLYDPEGMSFSNALAHNCPSGAFAGGVLDGNSNITMIPFNSQNVCAYNGSTGLFSNMVRISTTAPKLVGGVLLPNGNIIGIPFGTSNVIQYSPTTLTFSNIVIASGFFGGVLTPNGNVVCVPYTNGNVVVLNPTTGVFSNITAAGGANGFAGGVLLPNGQVALTPFTNSNVGLFNPTTLTFANITPQGVSTSNAYFGASLTTDGRVVFCPNQSQYVGVLNTVTPLPSAEYRLVPYINKL